MDVMQREQKINLIKEYIEDREFEKASNILIHELVYADFGNVLALKALSEVLTKVDNLVARDFSGWMSDYYDRKVYGTPAPTNTRRGPQLRPRTTIFEAAERELRDNYDPRPTTEQPFDVEQEIVDAVNQEIVAEIDNEYLNRGQTGYTPTPTPPWYAPAGAERGVVPAYVDNIDEMRAMMDVAMLVPHAMLRTPVGTNFTNTTTVEPE